MEKLAGKEAELAGRVLARMAELLKLGWTQNSFARAADKTKRDPEDADACAWCLHGAKMKAVAETFGHDENTARSAVNRGIGNALFEAGATYNWNDAPERTLDEVLGAVERTRGVLL